MREMQRMRTDRGVQRMQVQRMRTGGCHECYNGCATNAKTGAMNAKTGATNGTRDERDYDVMRL